MGDERVFVGRVSLDIVGSDVRFSPDYGWVHQGPVVADAMDGCCLLIIVGREQELAGLVRGDMHRIALEGNRAYGSETAGLSVDAKTGHAKVVGLALAGEEKFTFGVYSDGSWAAVQRHVALVFQFTRFRSHRVDGYPVFFLKGYVHVVSQCLASGGLLWPKMILTPKRPCGVYEQCQFPEMGSWCGEP